MENNLDEYDSLSKLKLNNFGALLYVYKNKQQSTRKSKITLKTVKVS